MSWQGVHKILKREKLVYDFKRVPKKEKWQKKRASYPGELVQIDIKYSNKINGNWLYQHTATDVATKLRHIAIYDSMGNYETIKFANEVK